MASARESGSGIAYAAREGATVINLSLGGPAGPGDSFMANAIAEADQRNATVVAAAGNDAKNNDTSPSTPCTFTHPNLICVAAVNQSGALAGFSNFGAATVDVGGPGTAILSTKSDWQAPVFSEGFEAGVSPPCGIRKRARTTSRGEKPPRRPRGRRPPPTAHPVSTSRIPTPG